MTGWRVLGVIGACGMTLSSYGQSLFQKQSTESEVATEDEDRATVLYGMSLFAVKPPEPRTFEAHDLVTILIRENTNMKREHTYEEDKSYNSSVEMIEWSQLREMLKYLGRVNPASTLAADPLADYARQFEGESEYERKEKIYAQVTARVVEVKPNGTILLEARTTVQTDEEIQIITLTGLCRTEDIAEANTIESGRMFNMTLNVQHQGQMHKATRKGLIPRVLESIFNF
ncbi:MAG: flagellar basal body L-ring protein FlgH [Phycisphaerales bacterium JB043]